MKWKCIWKPEHDALDSRDVRLTLHCTTFGYIWDHKK